MIPAIQIFMRDTLGEEFIFPPALNLAEIYKNISSTLPLIFVYSPGSDPFVSLNVFSQQKVRTIRLMGGAPELPLGCELDVDAGEDLRGTATGPQTHQPRVPTVAHLLPQLSVPNSHPASRRRAFHRLLDMENYH
jgi:hypothetical protein